MKLIKLTAFGLLLFSSIMLFTSCETDAELKKTTDFSKTGIILSSAQEIPANSSTALGSMDVFYTRETRILTYSVSWTGLTGAVTAMHIHGLGSPGYNAPILQNIIAAGGVGIFAPGSAYGINGKVSASLLIDGVFLKEQDLLNGNFYMNIHTAANPGGEIRGQIKFQ
jgi:hypothetical protein